MHPTGGSAAANVATETAAAAVTREASVAATTAGTMPTPALREGWHQRQRKDERRNGNQATHTDIISPFGNRNTTRGPISFSLPWAA